MQKIYKYHVFLDDAEVGISVPVGAKPIWAEGVFIFYQFDTANQYTMEMRRVYAAYTGANMPDHGTYVASSIDKAGIVRHFYEL